MRPDAGEGEKRTNEIGTVIPLLETLPDIANRTVTADALLTQRALAKYLLGRGADYLFTVKGNQPTLQDDIRLLLDETIARRAPDFMNEGAKPEHGRRERRSIWVSSGLNDYLNFPGVGQVFAIRRETREVKSGKRRCETAYGVTSLTPEAASPERPADRPSGPPSVASSPTLGTRGRERSCPDDAVAASGVKGERYKAARAQPNPAPSRFKGANTGWCPMIEPAFPR